MAVPKKRTSKSKTRSRKSQWKKKAELSAIQALSLAKSCLTSRANSFVYISKDSALENLLID